MVSRTINKVPDKTTKKLTRALQLHKKGETRQAAKLYQSVLHSDPGNADALHYLGILAHRSGEYAEASRLISKAIKFQPNYVDAHKNLGNVLVELQQYTEAELCYRKVIELHPEDPTIWSNLCVVLRYQRKLDEAISAGRTAVQMAPEKPVGWYSLGNVYRVQNKFKKAILNYEKAIALNPHFSVAYDSLCQCTYRMERSSLLGGRHWKKSIRAYERWLAVEPENPTAVFMLKALKGDENILRAPDEVVRGIFDSAANEFDQHIRGLEYRVPELIATRLKAHLGPPNAQLNILDGGCGTGLCAQYLKPYAAKLTGVDLSSGMLAKARTLNLYDELIESELTTWIKQSKDAFDVVVFGDTLCYFGDLGEVIQASAGAVRNNGLLVFSVEKMSADTRQSGYELQPFGRYIHSKRYIDDTLSSAAFMGMEYLEKTIRMEILEPVTGLIVSARK